MTETISLDEIHDRVGRLIYGSDYIDGLTDAEFELIRDHGPQERKTVFRSGDVERRNHIEPCPVALRGELDSALGRQARMEAQTTTINTELLHYGFPAGCWIDRARFESFMRAEEAKKAKAEREVGRGRQYGKSPDLRLKVEAEMRADIAAGKISIGDLRGHYKRLEGPYRAGKDTIIAACKNVLEQLSCASSSA
jgi:hypothetical protein